MPGFQCYVSVHLFKEDRVLFFRIRSVRDAYTARKQQWQARNQQGFGWFVRTPPRDHVGPLSPFFLCVFRKL